MATGCGDDMVRIFRETVESTKNEPTFELVVSEHQAHSQDVNTVRWHPKADGLLLTTSDDGNAKIWKFVA